MTYEFYLFGGLAVLLTGISKSGFAGGLGILAVPLMSLAVEPQQAVAIMMPILLAMDVANIWVYRRAWSARTVAILMPGALCGIALGAFTFQAMSADFLRAAIGCIALFFVAQYLYSRKQVAKAKPAQPAAILLVSTLSGFASFVAHAGGPPVKGYLLSRNMEKSEFVGTNGFYFFAVNFIKTVTYAYLLQFTTETLSASLVLTPFMVVGVVLGFRLHRLVSQVLFTQIAYVLLAVAGIRLLFEATF